ncbi:CoA transferase, partial [Streptomyces sp. SID685]
MSPRTVVRPVVAAAVADQLLRHTAPGVQQVRPTLDWSGPVGMELPDERAVQAACGLMHIHGRATGGPVPLAVDYASVVAGVLAAQGATAAGIGRARGLDLREVRTSVAQGALLAVGQYLAAATAREADGPSSMAGPEPCAGGLATLETADGARVELETLDPSAWRE